MNTLTLNVDNRVSPIRRRDHAQDLSPGVMLAPSSTSENREHENPTRTSKIRPFGRDPQTSYRLDGPGSPGPGRSQKPGRKGRSPRRCGETCRGVNSMSVTNYVKFKTSYASCLKCRQPWPAHAVGRLGCPACYDKLEADYLEMVRISHLCCCGLAGAEMVLPSGLRLWVCAKHRKGLIKVMVGSAIRYASRLAARPRFIND